MTVTVKRPRGKMSMSQAAFELLTSAESPMHYRELTSQALRGKMILTSGKTPEQSLRSQIAMEITRKKKKSRFVAKGSGVYALSAFGKKLARGEVEASPRRRKAKRKAGGKAVSRVKRR